MRPDKDETLLRMAWVASEQSTCVRRKVGCILVDSVGYVLATGWNGVTKGMPHCNEQAPCEGATAVSGTKLDQCLAIHAEQNALLQCRDVQRIETAYITVSPCIHCVKLLMNTSCRRLVVSFIYDLRALELWYTSGRGNRTSRILPMEYPLMNPEKPHEWLG